MGKFGKIPIGKKTIKIAVIEAESQRIIEETNEKLEKAGKKLLGGLKAHNEQGE